MANVSYKIVWWDWKDQPDWEEINKALKHLPGAVIWPVETEEDSYAVVIGWGIQDTAHAQKLYDTDPIINGEEN